MKQISRLLSLAAVTALCFSACTEELNNDKINGGKTVTVHFGTENTDPSTKATLTPDEGETAFQAAWVNEDKIAIKYTYVDAGITDIVPGKWDASASKFSADLTDITTGDDVREMKYQASYPYSETEYVDFGSARTQTGNAYNSVYDLMVAEPVTATAKPGLDEDGKAIVFPMQRQTAIAYFHFTSDNTEAITKATLKVEGEGAAIAAGEVVLDPLGIAIDSELPEIVLTTTDQTADDFTLWFNVLPTSYTKMTLTVETATKTFTISKATPGSYVAGKLYKVKKENVVWSKLPSTVYFYESFDQTTGTGGNDGRWSGSIASSTIKYDNTGWSCVSSGGANQCIKLGASSTLGSATTPALGITSGSATLWFKAAAWSGDNENLKISIDGNGTVSPTSVTLADKAWTEYYCTISGADADTKIVFSASQKSSNRFFLDEVYVYSGPNPLNSVSVISSEGGTITPSHSSAKEGTEITLTATPEVGYKFNEDWVVKDADDASITVTDNKFTMPASNVTVSGSFSKIDYIISKTASEERGSFVAKKGETTVETAQIGDEITLAATPNEGYELKSWTVVDSKDNAITVNDNKFTMPASNVTVSATFISTASYTVSFSVNGTVTTKSYKETETIEFPDVPAQDGVKFMGWTTSDISGIVSSKPELVDVKRAVMGTNNISYYAVFAAVETAVFDPTDLSATPSTGTLTWKHTATGVTLKLSAGSHYTSGTPNTFTVTKGTSNYFQISSDNNYIISEIETTLSGTDYKINKVSSGATLSTSGTTQTVKSDNLTSIQCFATSGDQIRATKITVTVITGYSTKIIKLNAVAVSGTPAKTEYTVDEAFDPTGLTVTGTYSNGESAQISDGISWTFTPSTFEASGNQSVSVIATVKSIKSAAYDVNVTVNTISTTLTATDGSVKVGETLNVSTLFASDSDGAITYSLVDNPSGATLNGTTFTASAAGTYKVKAAQAVTTKYSAAEATATITVTNAPLTTAYTIKFVNASSDSSTSISSSTSVQDIVQEGLDYVNGFTSTCSKAYKGKNGVKLGSSGKPGTLEFTLKGVVTNNVVSIKVVTVEYGTDSSTVTMYSGTTSLLSGIAAGQSATYEFQTPSSVSSLKFVSTSREYISEVVITVNNN